MSGLRFSLIKSEVKQNVKLSLPLIASQVLYSANGFLGTLMLARLGKDVLAASILVWMVWAVVSITFFGMLNAISVLVAHQFGAKNNKGVGDVMSQALVLGLILIVVISLALTAVPLLLSLSHQSARVTSLANQYMESIRLWVPSLTLMIVIEQFLIGLGKTRMVMCVSILLVPLQVFLTYAFIFGSWHFPRTGIAGVGYGIALADTIGLFFLVAYLLLDKQFRVYALFSRITLNWPYLKELIKIGFPMGMMSFIEIGAFTVMTYGVARFGTTQLAAHQIAFQFLGLLITIVFAMSQAVTVRVGHAVGELNREQVNYAIGVGMVLNACIMSIFASIVYLFPQWLVHFDLNIHAVKNIALVNDVTVLFHIIAFLMVFDNFRIIGFGALRGIKDTNFPMVSSFIAFWVVGLSLGFLLGFHFHEQAAGVWLGMTLGILSGAMIVFARLIYQLKRINLNEIRAV